MNSSLISNLFVGTDIYYSFLDTKTTTVLLSKTIALTEQRIQVVPSFSI